MPTKNKPGSQEAHASASDEKGAPSGQTDFASSSSGSGSIPVFFTQPKHGLNIDRLDFIPVDLLKMIASYGNNSLKELIALAGTSKESYRALYLSIKKPLVKILKNLVKEDNTTQVEKLLKAFPKIQLRNDELDPEGKAYQGIITTPYQDTLADPFAEEMRTLLEESFPGKTNAEKRQHAALQAVEFKDSRFDQFREEKRKIMELTAIAYKTYQRKYDAWKAAGYNDAGTQAVRDAWMRLGLIQNQWSVRLRKIFSWVDMEEKQTFEDLPRDLQDPCFYRDLTEAWLPGTVKGCDFRLMSVPATQDLSAADFKANLRAIADGYPVLIGRGEGEEATYHLYAPHVTLDKDKDKDEFKDEVEWQVVPINDPALVELIKWGRPPPYSEVAAAVDFSRQTLYYNSVFDDLYRFYAQLSLHVGSGASYIFAVYKCGDAAVVAIAGLARVMSHRYLLEYRHLCDLPAKNFAAVTALYEKRTERLAKHLHELEHDLPEQKTSSGFGLGPK